MPEYTVTGKWKMHWLNRAVYDNLPSVDPYALYWIKDQNIVFRGDKPLLDNFAQVEEFVTPYAGSIKPKTLCFKLSDVEGEPYFEARVLNTDYTWSVVVPPVYGFIETEGTEDKTLPTRNAVRTFVADRLDELREYFDALNNSMAEKLDQAQQAATIAADAATDANASANDSFVSAIKSESYAVGGTDSRPGENTDNAKWYKEQAEAAAEQGGGSAEEARQYAEAAAQSASEALDSEHNAATSESNAAASERAAAQSEANAAASESAAQLSEQHAAASESAAQLSEQHAAASESNAHNSEVAAHDSEVAAAASAAAALTSEGKAKQSEINAANSATEASGFATNASNSAIAAHNSEVAADGSKVAAAASAAAALSSEGKAKTSEQNAAASESAAAGSATSAEQSAISAYNSANSASGSAAAAHTSEVNAKASETKVEQDAAEAASSAQAAEQSEQDAAAKAVLAESWAVGGTGTRDGEDTNNAEYWAEQARQASPDGKADKVLNAVEGDLAGLDSAGNLTDSGIPADNVAQQDGWYDDLHSGTAGNLVDPRAPSTERKFGFDTSCGNVSISDDGTADPTLIKGTTYVKNQLVGDSKVIKDVGQGVVTSPYAVSGDIDHAYIKGRSLVRNQLVPASVEKEGSSSTGVVDVSDAVAGDALALKTVAPRSVVVNQLVQNGNFANETTGWTRFDNVKDVSPSLWTVQNNALTIPCDGEHRATLRQNTTSDAVAGHTYLVYFEYNISANVNSVELGLSWGWNAGFVSINTPTVGSWVGVSGKNTIPSSFSASTQLVFNWGNVLMTSIPANGESLSIRNIQLVDLTQYFNGDQTLIDSIQSWDDLVAYDPRFAQYVEYNTGTVVGVQPTVKVTGKNLFDAEHAELLRTNGTMTITRGQGTITGTNVNSSSNSVDLKILEVSSLHVGKTLYINGLLNGHITADAELYYGKYQNGAWTIMAQGAYTIQNSDIGAVLTLRLRNNAYTSASDVFIWSNLQVELGSVATAYEPYHDGGTAQAPASLFAVGTAADEFEAVAGVTTRNNAYVDLTGNESYSKSSSYSSATASVFYITSSAFSSVFANIKNITGNEGLYIAGGYISNKLGAVPPNSSSFNAPNTFALSTSTIKYFWLIVSPTITTATELKTWLAEQYQAGSPIRIYYQAETPTTSQSTPTQIALQAGNNTAMQTDGGRTASSIALGYDGTSFDVPLKTGRSYLVKKGSTSTLVTDGSTQSVTGGQDMIVDLTMLYNNVSSLISPIADWNALVSDTGMYGSYTAYDEGTVVHSDQTEVKVTGKNLLDDSLRYSTNRTYSIFGSTTLTGGTTLPPGTYTAGVFKDGEPSYRTKYVFIDNHQYGSYSSNPITFTLTKTSTVQLRVYPYLTDLSTGGYNAQIELGSAATSYEPCFDGGTATAGLLKGVPGSVYDQLDAVTGNVTTRIGSYTFTGNETWTQSSGARIFYNTGMITTAYRTTSGASIAPFFMDGYQGIANAITSDSPDKTFCLNVTAYGANVFRIRDDSCADSTALNVKLAGKTVYYRLATYTKSTTTPQPLTQPTGGLTVLQTAGTLPVNLDVMHAVSEWDEPIVRNCKYIFRDNGEDSLVTGSTTVTYKHVVGGEHKLINLTQWFGRTREPSIANFYKLFPTWKYADIPYDGGTILNYKGTGVRTIGFNAYNHSTGTAVLLGGNQYQICGTYTSVSYVDQWGSSEEIAPDSDGLFTPLNNGALTVVGGNDTDTCVHLTWSGYKNFGEEDYEYLPYEEKGVTWDLSQYFPSGMNGIGYNTDEITNTSATTNWGIKVFNGTENFTSYGTYYNSVMYYVSDMATGSNMEGASSLFVLDKGSTLYDDGYFVRLGSDNKYAYLIHALNMLGTDYVTVDDWKAYLASLYAAGTPLVLIYPLATPTTTTVTPTKNFSYPVNDFGTEQSLPVNTLTLTTTDLNAEIRYSLDFTRTVQHYSEIEDDVEQLVEEKDNLARQDGNYADKGGTYTYATQLKDPNAQSVEASYGNRTAAGDVTIADNGTADVASLQGTTQIQNQLVHDTNMNEKSSTDGKLVVTDAVGGDVTKLLLKGGCVVHNQLVQDSVEKTATGTGRLYCEDGVAGNAKALVMAAPRSVVMNQQVDMIDTNKCYAGNVNVSIDDTTITLTPSSDSTTTKVWSFKYADAPWYVVGHVYIMYAEIRNNSSLAAYIGFREKVSNSRVLGTDSVLESDTFVAISMKGSLSTTSVYFSCTVANSMPSSNSVQFRNVMCVDLTQYFNGNTTLINSINTWDDLVAYDSTFASYVPYDTGTVKGVQPTVKVNHTTDVACPAELFGIWNGQYDTMTEDSFNGVSGVLNKTIGVIDLGTLTWSDYYAVDTDHPYGYTNSSAIVTKKNGYLNIIAANYMAKATFTTDKQVFGEGLGNKLRLVDSSLAGKTGAQIATALSGKLLYYELDTPITTQYTPTTIPTVDIYNTALQTAGTRSCGLSLTYDGKDQTIALNTNHKYIFCDNEEEYSVITGQSSVNAVGGEDQLIDITQFYNGDTTKINQITSYGSLSARYPRYRDFQPYNPGTVEPVTATMKVFSDEYAYGVLYDPNQNSPVCQRVELHNGAITEVDSFSSMPCHQLYRCVMDDLSTRHINYYLDDNDSTKKYNGTRNGVTSDGSDSVLTGADGDVMVEIPVSYWYLDEDYNGTGKYLWLISDRPFMGTHNPAEIHDYFFVSPNGDTARTQYVGAYRASICDADGNALNTTEGALTQTTGTASTNKARSIAGALPYVSVSQGYLLTRASRNGASTVNTKFHQWLFLLMAVESSTLDNQTISYGYAGGINNAFCFCRRSGRVNAGNGTASLTAAANTQDMDNFQKFTIGSTTVQRDTNQDADGRYAWSVYNRNTSSTRYFTSSPTPSNGDPVYTASTGTSTAGTVASYALQSHRTIQFQYRGIENPFGEVWEFEHGFQKYMTGELKSFRGTDNLTYTRDPVNDGASSRAWLNNGTVVWTTTGSLTTSTFLYSDPDLTTVTTVKYKDQPYYRYSSEGYWETLATGDYTSTAQRTAVAPTYTDKHKHWPLSGWDSLFDPVTFFYRKTGSSGAGGRYLPDYYYNDGAVGDRVGYRGGNANHGASVGLGSLVVYIGLSSASVYISGRLSA